MKSSCAKKTLLFKLKLNDLQNNAAFSLIHMNCFMSATHQLHLPRKQVHVKLSPIPLNIIPVLSFGKHKMFGQISVNIQQ